MQFTQDPAPISTDNLIENEEELSKQETGHESEKVTIGVVTYNRRNILAKTLESLQALDYPSLEVMVVDNHSTDGSLEWVMERFPEFNYMCLEKNFGPNVARNLILKEATTDYVMIMDNDIILEQDALTRMMDVMKKVPQAALCHAEIRDLEDPNQLLHYNGGSIHFLGALAHGKPASGSRPEWEAFDVVSGQVLLLRRDMALNIGGFDDYYFFGWTDGDFTVRLSLAGYLVLNVPGAVGHHNSSRREVPKVFYQVRNRWYFMLKTYSLRTLVLSYPALLVYELSLMLLLIAKGAWGEYLRGNWAVVRDLPEILRARRQVQRMKKKSDRDWLVADDLFVPETVTNKTVMMPVMRLFNGFFEIYWRALRPILTFLLGLQGILQLL